MRKYIFILFSLSVLFPSVMKAQSADSSDAVKSYVNSVKEKYVPDTREAIFDVKFLERSDTLAVWGATSSKKAYSELKSHIAEKTTQPLEVNLKLLPSKALDDTLYGVVNVSVADIRTQNRFTSGMATQSLLGTPVKMYDFDSWYRVQFPDTYFGWIHAKQVVPMTRKEINAWLIAPKVIFTSHYGFAYQAPDRDGAVVSDLAAGDILKYDGVEGSYFRVEYPDKRIGYVLRSESQEYAFWERSRELSADSFIQTAKTMTGIPYVWGGTSTKGLDCSGLVSTVLNLHGLSILRDASQQANVGKVVDITEGYEKLRPGDLMFFGKKGEGGQADDIRHVGFYLGNNKFIHASGWVRESSLNPADADYDELNTREFIKATRIIDNGKLIGVSKTADSPFWQLQ